MKAKEWAEKFAKENSIVKITSMMQMLDDMYNATNKPEYKEQLLTLRDICGIVDKKKMLQWTEKHDSVQASIIRVGEMISSHDGSKQNLFTLQAIKETMEDEREKEAPDVEKVKALMSEAWKNFQGPTS